MNLKHSRISRAPITKQNLSVYVRICTQKYPISFLKIPSYPLYHYIFTVCQKSWNGCFSDSDIDRICLISFQVAISRDFWIILISVDKFETCSKFSAEFQTIPDASNWVDGNLFTSIKICFFPKATWFKKQDKKCWVQDCMLLETKTKRNIAYLAEILSEAMKQIWQKN